MSRQFFLSDGQQSYGRFDEARVREDLAAQRVRPDSLCWSDRERVWLPLVQVAPELFVPVGGPAG